jgi:23S rRNA (adenine2030-N6)-methyltransferase
MLAYRHAFHAGNHADVIKHAVMLYCLDYLQQKPGPVLVVDTHAGSGQYRVGEPLMRGKGEFNTGVLPLFEKKGEGVPPLIEAYLQEVRRLNTGTRLERIPGSPVLIAERLRAKDLLHAFELHPSDFSHLSQTLGGYGRRVKVHHANGFEAPRALLPNVSKRALVVIDPSYELRTDYAKAWACIKEILQRMAHTVVVVWMPMIQRFELQRFLTQLHGLEAERLQIDLRVRPPLDDGLGLLGSHLMVINPPYGLKEACDQALPWLVRALGQDPLANGRTVVNPRQAAAVVPRRLATPTLETPRSSGPRSSSPRSSSPRSSTPSPVRAIAPRPSTQKKGAR